MDFVLTFFRHWIKLPIQMERGDRLEYATNPPEPYADEEIIAMEQRAQGKVNLLVRLYRSTGCPSRSGKSGCGTRSTLPPFACAASRYAAERQLPWCSSMKGIGRQIRCPSARTFFTFSSAPPLILDSPWPRAGAYRTTFSTFGLSAEISQTILQIAKATRSPPILSARCMTTESSTRSRMTRRTRT